eukprot:COSAG04_NODE_25357_length_308_cov_1.966507_2_plen_44_part_01
MPTVVSMWLNSGSRKPSVLPEPVLATPIMSLPASPTGQHCDWIP